MEKLFTVMIKKWRRHAPDPGGQIGGPGPSEGFSITREAQGGGERGRGFERALVRVLRLFYNFGSAALEQKASVSPTTF